MGVPLFMSCLENTSLFRAEFKQAIAEIRRTASKRRESGKRKSDARVVSVLT